MEVAHNGKARVGGETVGHKGCWKVIAELTFACDSEAAIQGTCLHEGASGGLWFHRSLGQTRQMLRQICCNRAPQG